MSSLYKSFIVGAILISALVSRAQNSVAIGQSSTDPSAVLLLMGNGSQGLIIPVVSSLGSFGKAAMMVYNSTDKQIHYHDGTAWNTVGGSGSTFSLSYDATTKKITLNPNTSGTASIDLSTTVLSGGDLNGTLATPTVVGIQGKQFASNTLPTSGVQYLAYDATQSKWVFQTPAGTGDLLKANNLSDLVSSSTARNNLGLGTLATLSAVTTTEITDGTIANVDISNTAAIAGSKITPAFGSQNISTTGTLSTGAASLASVNIAGQLGVGSVPSFGTAGQVLTSAGAGVAPTWTTISGGGNMLSTNNLSDVASVVTSRNNLGLGTLATLSAVSTTEITDGTIANVDVSNTAAIAGSKIVPAFGSQNISTTGTLSSGASTHTSLSVPGTTTLNSVAYTWPGSQGAASTVLTNNGSGTLSWSVAGGTGTVQSVGLTLPSLFSVTGSPITTTGTLSASLASQSANTIFAAPNGSTGVPTFRALVASDIPSLSASQIVSGTLPVAVGGTGASSLTGLILGNGSSAFTAITTGSNGQVLTVNAGVPSWQNAPTASGTAGGDLSGTYPNPTIASGVVTSTKLATSAVATANIAANAVDDTKILNVAPSKITQASATSGQVLKWNGTAWAPAADNVGGGGAPTLNSGQIMVGDGTTNSAATVSLDASLNSTNGNVTVQGLQGRPISTSVPATNSVYQYNGTQWTPVVLSGGGTVSSITTGTGLTGGPITSTGTISISPGGVTATELASSSVTNTKIAASSVNSSQIIDGSIVDADISSSAGIAVTKLATGTNGQVLTVNAGIPSWQTPSSLTNPMTAAGDIIYGGAGGTPTKLTTGTGFLKGGTTPAYSSVNLASADVSGTLPLTGGGTGATTATAARTNLGLGTLATLGSITTTEITDGTVTDVDVSSSAAISGTKINPAFGTQNISTTGTLSSGAATVTGLTVSGSSTSFNNKTYTWPNNPTLLAGTILQTDASGNLSWVPAVGAGTVMSVGLSMPSIFTVSNSPVTTSGTLTAVFNSQTANTFLAAPNGASGVPTFRTLVSADVPNLDASKITTGTLPVANGGTGATTATTARTNLGLGTLSTLNAVTTTELTDGTITNVDISGTAAIAGSKITPAFGTQNISTTGTLSAGATTVTGLTIGTSVWPASTAGVLTNDGTGTLTWGTAFTNPMTAAGDIIYGGVGGAATRLATGTGFLKGGATPTYAAVNLAGTDVTGTLPLTKGGTGATTATAARTNLGLGTLATLSAVTATEISDGTIADIDVSTSANINGSKINPTFGAQAISTTSTLTTGSAGQFVVDNAGNITKINNITTSFPANQGAANTVLTNDGAGNLTWGSLSSSSWSLTGNSGTTASTNFVGTTDANDLVLKTNGTENMRITNASGNIGIGTSTPGYKLNIYNGDFGITGANANFYITGAISGVNQGTDASPRIAYGYNTNASGGFGATAIGYDASATGTVGVALGQSVTAAGYSSMALGYGITVSGDNSVGIGMNAGNVDVATANTMAIMGGNVGIGTVAPNFKLGVNNASTDSYIQVTSNTTGTTSNDGFMIGTGTAGDAALINRESTNMVFHTSNTEQMRIDASGNVGIGTTSPNYKMHVMGSNPSIAVEESGTSNSNLVFRRGGADKWYLLENYGSPSDNLAFYDASTATKPLQFNQGGFVGIGGATAAIGASNFVVAGSTTSFVGMDITSPSTTGIPYYAYNNGTARVWTQFDGTTWSVNAGATRLSINRTTGAVSIPGSLSKGSGTFKIDHPQDPENKFLYHSFVESPDMMNVYNGNIVTSSNGEAVVSLPNYFESLNKDFRYQLTVIGDFAQAIVFKKVENNKFVIKTDKPNIEVSWQVTGIRKDPFAEKNRVVPEVEKSEEEKGKYLHPEAYGLPSEKGIGNKKNP